MLQITYNLCFYFLIIVNFLLLFGVLKSMALHRANKGDCLAFFSLALHQAMTKLR